MTTAEYEIQSRMIGKDLSKKTTASNDNNLEGKTNPTEETSSSTEANGQTADNAEMKKPQDSQIIQPLNLRMLQGAFIVLVVGYTMAGRIKS